MTDVTRGENRGLQRRTVLRNGLLAGLGVAAVSISSTAIEGTAQAFSYQTGWKWCSKCRGLFYGPQQSASHCPAGGTHDSTGSWPYTMFYDDPSSGGILQQQNWSWCGKCTGLFYGPKQSYSICPAGGPHDGSGSYNYSVAYNTGQGQPNWNWCLQCQGLFYGPQQSVSHCPAGGTHDGSRSYNYSVTY